jgi:hypothetical protein
MGTLAGVTQAAQQNYLQQNAPQAQEAAADGQAPQDAQSGSAPAAQDEQAPTGWPN